MRLSGSAGTDESRGGHASVVSPGGRPSASWHATVELPGISKSTGQGIGLYITRGIIEKHGGTIEVQSEVGEETTLTVAVPVGDRDTASSTG